MHGAMDTIIQMRAATITTSGLISLTGIVDDGTAEDTCEGTTSAHTDRDGDLSWMNPKSSVLREDG